jgi:plasmid stabilization system protein ParE
MAHRVNWSRRALQDLEGIADYIAADSPTYAGIVVKKVLDHTKTLANFPRAGRKVPEFDDENIRELMIYSYRIIYRLQGNRVVIAAIVHGRRILQ